MFKKILLKQSSGTKLKFKPESQMGFVSGENHIVAEFYSYQPSSTQVNLHFFSSEKGVPSESIMGQDFSTSFTSQVSSITPESGVTAEQAIEAAITQSVINHLKSFNANCSFETAVFSPRVEPF